MKSIKNRYYFAFVAGITLATTIIRNQNNYNINNQNLTAISRSTGPIYLADKKEYTKLKDGSEEVEVRDGRRVYLFQNLDGDNTVDRIRIDKHRFSGLYRLENILVRKIDYKGHEQKFKEADQTLLEERKINQK